MNGIKEDMAGRVDVVHLNLVSAVGREVGNRYGVKIVPTTLLFNGEGELVARVNGMPKKARLIAQIQEQSVYGR